MFSGDGALAMDVVGVVLGGGEGKRFGGDKLVALVNGHPSVTRVASVLRRAGAHFVYVLTRSEARCKLYRALAELDDCLYDRPGRCKGPGFALASLASLSANYVLVAPGDAPWLSPSVYRNLVGFLDDCDIAVPLHGNGFLETLVLAIRGSFLEKMRHIAEYMCALRGDTRPSDYVRFAHCSVLVGSSLLGVLSPSSFAHINTREALRTRNARNPLGEKKVIELRSGGLFLETIRDKDKFCEYLLREARTYIEKGLTHLARHARRDYEYICTPQEDSQ